MASKIQNNNISLEQILATINALPEEGAGGVDLPELSNPGSASELLANYELINGEGNKIIGTMPDNGAISSTMDGLETKSVSIPAGYTSGGTVALDSTIDNTANSQATQIDEIMELLEEKSAGDGGSGGSAETCTVTISGESSNYRPYYISYMTNEDVPAKAITNNSNLSVTLQNVLCGSVVTVSFYSNVGSGSFLGDTTNAELIAYRDCNFIAFKITAPSEGTATIYNSSSHGGGSVD